MTNLDENFIVQEDLPDHHFRTEIPNVVEELDLDPYEYRVYAKLKSIAGDAGKCWQSREQMYKSLKIGKTKFDQCLAKLESIFPEINKPLIRITRRKKNGQDRDTHIITIVPIWRENGNFFRNRLSATRTRVVRHADKGCPPGGHKQDLSNNNVVVVIEEKKLEECGKLTKPKVENPILKDPSLFPCFQETVNPLNTKIPKEEVFRKSLQEKRDWSTQEIEEAYSRYENSRQQITDPLSYISGIINKMREQKSKQDKKNDVPKKEKNDFHEPQKNKLQIGEKYKPTGNEKFSLKNWREMLGTVNHAWAQEK